LGQPTFRSDQDPCGVSDSFGEDLCGRAGVLAFGHDEQAATGGPIGEDRVQGAGFGHFGQG
jgi:hypothetical protein